MLGEGGRDEDGGTAEGVSESVAGVQEGRSHLTRDCLEAVMATFDLGRSHQNLCSSQVSWKRNFSLFSAVALASPVACVPWHRAARKERRKERKWRAARAEEVGNKHHTTLRFYTDGAYLVHIT